MAWIKLNDRGATLIELLFSSTIMIVVTASFYQLIGSFYQSYQSQEQIAEVQQQARVAADLLSREMQMAGYDPKGSLFLPDNKPNESRQTKGTSKVGCEKKPHPAERILEAAPGVIHFLADLNGSTFVDDSISTQKDLDEDVRYEWVGAGGIDSCGTKRTPFTLYRDTGGGGGAQEVATDIDSLKLAYSDEEGRLFPERSLTESERARIRKVVMTVHAQSDPRTQHLPSQGGLQGRQVTFEVQLRNM
ncbi:MAG: hypothetical protein HY282_17405 [Nitrospirae bacterium]|nr:hypothetical protein [Candidatus Manganitrophaceae bacterium]